MKQSHFSAEQSDGSEAGHTSRVEINWKKNTRFEEIDEDEMSSEGQVETSGIDKENTDRNNAQNFSKMLISPLKEPFHFKKMKYNFNLFAASRFVCQ